MKKRFFSLFLSCVLIFSLFGMFVYANEVELNNEIILLENGDYIEVETIWSQARISRTATKSYTYRNSEGSAMWEAVLTAGFTYDGTTSSCTSASCNVTVYNSSYSMVTKHAYRSGNTAYASVTMSYTTAGVTTSQSTYKITLSCDENGNLS